MFRGVAAAVSVPRGFLCPLVNSNCTILPNRLSRLPLNLYSPHHQKSAMGTTGSRPLGTTDFIDQTVGENCVVIFSKTTCGYCRMAKRVFEDIGTPYHAVELNKREDGPEIQQALHKMTGDPTVPRVFINGQCIGGGTDTKAKFNSGELLTLLQQCSNPEQ